MRTRFDVIVVGAGPAGSAAALKLAIWDPGLARDTLLLDGQPFAREKLCGGGLVAESERLLRHLGIANGFRSVPIHRIVYEYPGGRAVKRAPHLFRVVHRREFDEALVLEARRRGVEFREGDPVRGFEREADGVTVLTESGACFSARLIVGADGAFSKVRRALVGPAPGERFVAIEALTPGHDDFDGAGPETAVFDFRPVARGVRGYAWDFPSLRGGEPWMNRGLCGATRSGSISLMDAFSEVLGERGVACERREILGGAGPRFYDPEYPQGAERVLLAGDAVGIDPWFGEGISVALGTGILAANAAAEALATGNFDFRDHASRIARSAVGWSLLRRVAVAERFYGPASTDGEMGAFLGGETVRPPGIAAAEGSVR